MAFGPGQGGSECLGSKEPLHLLSLQYASSQIFQTGENIRKGQCLRSGTPTIENKSHGNSRPAKPASATPKAYNEDSPPLTCTMHN